MVASSTRHLDSTCPCPRCGGVGTIEQFRHVENGRCFECSGTGTSGRRATREAPGIEESRRTPGVLGVKAVDLPGIGRALVEMYEDQGTRTFALKHSTENGPMRSFFRVEAGCVTQVMACAYHRSRFGLDALLDGLQAGLQKAR